MVRLLRFALLAMITLLLVSVIIGIGTGTVGVVEKAVLAAIAIGLVLAASTGPAPGSRVWPGNANVCVAAQTDHRFQSSRALHAIHAGGRALSEAKPSP